MMSDNRVSDKRRDHTGDHTRDHTGSDSDAALFDRLFDEHHRVLYAFLTGQCGDPERAQDLVQETFLRAWKHIGDLRALVPEQRRFYLLAIARNLIYDSGRRARVRQHLNSPLPDERTLRADMSGDPVAALSAKETQAALDKVMAALPVDLRTALSLHLLGEMTSGEIGETLGIPAGTVRYRISQARQCLAQALNLTSAARPKGKEAVNRDK